MNHKVELVTNKSIQDAKEVIRIEAEAVASLEDRIGQEFEKAVELILNTSGRVIITGVGKSGLVGQKIAATLCSTGTSAFFMHSVDAIHGDSGMVREEDVALCISKSGNGEELGILVGILKRIGVPVIALVGNTDSPLARNSDVVLDVHVRSEACPFDLTPTASTTATLALGDALAVALLKRRNFDQEDFALLHPGGNLGKRLLLKVKEFMSTGNNVPRVVPEATFKEILIEMNSKRFGGTCVVGTNNSLIGIITDGDLKRVLDRRSDFMDVTAGEIMSQNPKTIHPEELAVAALNKMKKYNIMQLVIVDNNDLVVGMVHLHDVLKAGIG